MKQFLLSIFLAFCFNYQICAQPLSHHLPAAVELPAAKTLAAQSLVKLPCKPYALSLASTREVTVDTVTTNLQSCDDVFYTWKFGPFSGEKGYISGHNTFLDSAKAEYYENLVGDTIKGVWMLFGKATNTNNTQKIHVKVWDATGPNGSPGAELASTDVTHQMIKTNVDAGDLTTVYFNPPVVNPGNVYVGFKLVYKKELGIPVYDSTRLVALANPDIFDGCADDSIENFAWELNTDVSSVGDGTWHSYWYSYNFATRNPIFPIVTLENACEITVNPTSATICKSKSVTLTASGATTYSWSPAEGLDVTSGAVVNASPKTTTTYSVTGDGGACYATVKVTVNQKPDVSISAAPCSTGSVLLTCTSTPSTGITFKWFKDGTKITGATTSTYSATTSAEYKCKVTITATGCSRTSNKINVNVNCRIGEPDTDWNASVYPNPFSHSFSLAVTSLSGEPIDILLLDLTGKEIRHYQLNDAEKPLIIEEDFTRGVYFMKVKQGEQEKMIKVVRD